MRKKGGREGGREGRTASSLHLFDQGLGFGCSSFFGECGEAGGVGLEVQEEGGGGGACRGGREGGREGE